MKRCLLAAGILACLGYGVASADFIIIKIELNQLIKDTKIAADPGAVRPPPTGGQKGKGGALPPDPAQPKPTRPQSQVFAYMYLDTVATISEIPKKPGIKIGQVEFKLEQQSIRSLLLANPGELALNEKSPSLVKRFDDKFNSELKEGSEDYKKKQLVIIAEWALQRGLQSQLQKCLDDLKKRDPAHPALVAVEKTREALKKKPKDDDPAAQALIKHLTNSGGEYRQPIISDKGHFKLVTDIPNVAIPDTVLKKKLAKLEEVYSAFFEWYALNGILRTPPAYRLVVVLLDAPANNTLEFAKKRASLTTAPLVGNGFTVQRDNVVFWASRRFDEAYEQLDNYNQSQMNTHKVPMSDLFNHWEQITKVYPQFSQDYELLGKLQTLALCQKWMDDETEMLALSHGTVRQLTSATGVLPHDVNVAQWARVGLASFFELPARAFYPCYAAPNWDHLIEFKAARQARKIDGKAAGSVLARVVADEYFRSLDSTRDFQTQKPKTEDDLRWARASAWALHYFLAHKKDKQLERYFAEIRALPRDLSFGADVLMDCFCRSFDLTKPNAANPSRPLIDAAKLDRLATEWFAYMDKSCWLDLPEYERTAVAERVKELEVRTGQ